jgi:glycosyltransferase involved in cell wall biosynthesis
LVVLNPVATLPSNPHVVKELQGKDPVVVGMTARLDMIKDHACVIRAFSAVLHRYPHAQLWFMGDGVLRSSLQQLCADLHIDKSVVFHGNVPNVYDYLQKLDIFVYSTTMAEGLGNVVSEAFANGLPCVISDLPMMREVAGDSRAALFFEPGNDKELAQRIVDLLRDAEKRESMSSSAYKWSSEAFSAQRYVNEGMKFLRQNENE